MTIGRLFEGADWDFHTLQRIHDACEEVAKNELGLDVAVALVIAFTISLELTLLITKSIMSPITDLVEATRDMVNADNIALMRDGAVLLNFSREGVVDDAAVLAQLVRRLAEVV